MKEKMDLTGLQTEIFATVKEVMLKYKYSKNALDDCYKAVLDEVGHEYGDFISKSFLLSAMIAQFTDIFPYHWRDHDRLNPLWDKIEKNQGTLQDIIPSKIRVKCELNNIYLQRDADKRLAQYIKNGRGE